MVDYSDSFAALFELEDVVTQIVVKELAMRNSTGNSKFFITSFKFKNLFINKSHLYADDLTDAFNVLYWLPISVDVIDFSHEFRNLFDESAHVHHDPLPTYFVAMKALYAPHQIGTALPSMSIIEKIRQELFLNDTDSD